MEHEISRGVRYKLDLQAVLDSLKYAGKSGSDPAKLNSFKKYQRDFVKERFDYSGVVFNNCFQVNKPIKLSALGFFGPGEEKQAHYSVFVEVRELRTNKVIFSEDGIQISGYQDKVFWINFGREIPIMPHTYYNIGFELNGPETGYLHSKKIQSKINGGGGVQFQFLHGSRQMPFLRYSTYADDEMHNYY